MARRQKWRKEGSDVDEFAENHCLDYCIPWVHRHQSTVFMRYGIVSKLLLDFLINGFK